MRDPEHSNGYVVVGAGAIGGTLAYHLSRSGHEATVVDADAGHVRQIAENGVTVVRDGQRDAVPVSGAFTVDAGRPAQVSRVLLAVKAQATPAALDWIAPRLADDGYVVSLQNGLNEPTIARRIGPERTVGAFVNLFADVTGPGEIRDGGRGALVVGETDGSESERVKTLVEDLQAWGPARSTTNVAGYLWSKLGFGAMLVATALADAPMADLIDAHRPLMHRLAAEVYAVAADLDIVLEPFDAFDPLPYAGQDAAARDAASDAARDAATGRLVAWLRTQSKDRSGIWRDIAVRRRPTEVPSHYTPVLELARERGIAVPGLTRLLEQIRLVESGEPMGTERLDDVAEAIA